MLWAILAIAILLYFSINLYVMKRIREAEYLDEERRNIHKWFIWSLPFVGPYLIRGFWKKRKKEEFDVVTKNRRAGMKSGVFGGLFGIVPGHHGSDHGPDGGGDGGAGDGG